MQGLMQDRPLTLDHFFNRAETLFPKQGRRHGHRRRASSARPTASGPTGPAGSAACSTTSGSRPTGGWPPSAGTRPATSSCTSPRRAAAGCCTRSTSGCSPSRSPTSSTTPRTRSSSSTGRWSALLWPLLDTFKTVRHVVVADDGRGDAADRRRVGRPARLRGAAGRGPAGRVAPPATRTRPRRCATRAAPPATPRASCTRTARPGCTPSASPPPTASAPASATRSCRSCPCSTPTPGGWPTPAWPSGANLVMPGPDLSAPALADAHRVAAGHGGGRACPPSGWACCPSWRAATRRTCGPSRAAARPCPGRCRRATASRWACPSCRRGG